MVVVAHRPAPGGRRRLRRGPRGVQDGHEGRPDPDALPRRQDAAGHPRALQRAHRLLAARGPPAVLPHLAHPETPHDGGETAHVIGVGMSGRHHGEPSRRQVPQERRHDPLSRVEASRASGAAVHEHPLPLREIDQHRVALAHVEEDHSQPAVTRAEPGPRRQRHRQGKEACRGATRPGPGARVRQQEQGRVPRRDGGPAGRRQVHHGRGDGRRRPHREAEQEQEGPQRIEKQAADRLAQRCHDHREEPERGSRSRQRDHREVGRHADERELVEVGGHDRGDGPLGGQAHGDGHGDEAWPAAGLQRGLQGRSRVDDAGGRGEGELEARIPEVSGAPGEQQERRQPEGIAHPGLALEQHPEEDQEPHHRGPQDRGLAAHDEGEAGEDCGGDKRRRAPGHAEEGQRHEDGSGEQRDVGAGDGQHVIDTGATERLVRLARHRAPLSQHEPRQEGRRALRQPRPHRRHRPSPDAHGPWRRVRRERPQPVAAAAADEDDALAPQVRRVVEGARIPEAHGRVEADPRPEALPFAQGLGALAVDGEQEASRGRPTGLVVPGRIHLEEEAHPVGGPADRLLGERPFHRDRALSCQGRDVLGRQRLGVDAQERNGADGQEERGRGQPLLAQREGHGRDRQQARPAGDQPRGGDRQPRAGRDAARPGERQRNQWRRGDSHPIRPR